jgi:radical SAM-linked protein
MHFAAPLPVGCGSEADLLDLSLDEARASQQILETVRTNTPRDLQAIACSPVAASVPALSEQLVEVEYRVLLRGVSASGLEDAVSAFLASPSVRMPKRGRKHRGKTYDLRALVKVLSAEVTAAPWQAIHMRLSARPGATGRPDEVLKALGLEALHRRCIRTSLILRDEP